MDVDMPSGWGFRDRGTEVAAEPSARTQFSIALRQLLERCCTLGQVPHDRVFGWQPLGIVTFIVFLLSWSVSVTVVDFLR